MAEGEENEEGGRKVDFKGAVRSVSRSSTMGSEIKDPEVLS